MVYSLFTAQCFSSNSCTFTAGMSFPCLLSARCPPLLLLKALHRRCSSSPPSPILSCRCNLGIQRLPKSKLSRSQRRNLAAGGDFEGGLEHEHLGKEGEVFQRTLRLVECAMFASVSALTYLLGNSLAIEVR